jgi:DNA-binding NarL/FixJ family response regulator
MGIRVAIGCRVHLFAEGLKAILESEPGIEIVGIAGSLEDLREVIETSPDVILADQAMSKNILGNNVPEASKVLCINESRGFLTEYGDLSEVVSKGFAGFLPSYADRTMLLKAIDSVSRGELWIDRKTMKETLVHKGKEEVSLTRRETEILNCLKAGDSNKEIAQKLFITEQTVKSHFNRLYKKFGVKNRLKLALLASSQDSEHYFHH